MMTSERRTLKTMKYYMRNSAAKVQIKKESVTTFSNIVELLLNTLIEESIKVSRTRQEFTVNKAKRKSHELDQSIVNRGIEKKAKVFSQSNGVENRTVSLSPALVNISDNADQRFSLLTSGTNTGEHTSSLSNFSTSLDSKLDDAERIYNGDFNRDIPDEELSLFVTPTDVIRAVYALELFELLDWNIISKIFISSKVESGLK